jgi:hypothetical protein
MHRLRVRTPFTSFNLLSYMKNLCAGLRYGRGRAGARGVIYAGLLLVGLSGRSSTARGDHESTPVHSGV